MRFLLHFALILCTNLAFTTIKAQGCTQGKDPFTGVETVEYLFYEILQFKSTQSGAILKLRHSQTAVVETTIPKGSPFLIKLENGTIIESTTTEDAKSRSGASTSVNSGGSTYSEVYLIVELSHDQLKQLSESEATHIRHMDFDGEIKTTEIANKYVIKHLTKGAKCMTDKK